MEIKEYGNARWMIEKEQGMNVPVILYGTQAILNTMKDGRTLEQAKNVSKLPGILRASMVMPDGHEGYGFPIGGVAAFDLEKGIVSPGGIGYDINCLSGNSKVLDQYKCWREIQDFEKDFELLAIDNGGVALYGKAQKINLLSKNERKIESSQAMNFMKKNAKLTKKIQTKCGFSLEGSMDHPVLTDSGMVPFELLSKGSRIAVYPFEGVKYEKAEPPFHPLIAKLVGFLMGDGLLYTTKENKTLINAYSKYKEDLEEIKHDIQSLGYKAYIYEKKGQFFLRCNSRELYSTLVNAGMPENRKTTQGYCVPEWILSAPLWIKRLFLAAFFGAEMSSPNASSKTCFYMPYVKQNKKDQYVQAGRNFFVDIITMLSEFGVQASKIYEMKDKKSMSIVLLLSQSDENLLNLWNKIGFEYNKKRSLLAQIAILFIHERNRERKKRETIIEKIIDYKKVGMSIGEVKQALKTEINERFIERHYYGCKTGRGRIALDFISFKEFVKLKTAEYNEFGCLLDEIVESTEIHEEKDVYDFTIVQTHNFIANSIIVSNCGVRLTLTNLTAKDVEKKKNALIDALFGNIPSGVGSEGKMKASRSEMTEACEIGAKWAVEKGYGWEEDLETTEERGGMKGASTSKVSDKAIKRGLPQFGTLGAGNHFMEVQRVEKIFLPEIAKAFGLFEGQAVVMFHCGSRGYGHQVCDDYIRIMLEASRKYNITLPDTELCCAPINSQEGQDYIASMYSAVNYAFTNRQIILHWVRETFAKVFGGDAKSLGMHQVYDVAHNIGKYEEHEMEGQNKTVFVHRKGATRAFGPNRKELSEKYKTTGQPVIIPGSMGTASYVLVGTDGAMKETFGSTCHGSGRVLSRHAAIRKYDGKGIRKEMASRGIELRAHDVQLISEEAPGAYKNVDDVVKSVEMAGISKIVARLVPIAVAKG